MNSSPHAADSTPRARRYRERRKHGLRLFTVTVPGAAIENAVTRGLLAAEDQTEPWSVVQSCYAAQLSEAALEWLIDSGLIKREQRSDAAAVLRSISTWLEHAQVTVLHGHVRYGGNGVT